LFEAAQQAGVKQIIFISSISAFTGCRSVYGKTKLQVEQAALAYNGTVIRPGLIYGNLEQLGGMMGALVALMDKVPALPVFYPDPPVYLCHQQDLADLVVSKVQRPVGSEIITAAFHEPLGFKAVLSAIAVQRSKKSIFLPVPWRLIYLPIRLFEILGLKLGFKSDSLLSLMKPVPNPVFLDSEKEFREFSDQVVNQ
jgi:nucleoside-diphosphate-sugar epimerase